MSHHYDRDDWDRLAALRAERGIPDDWLGLILRAPDARRLIIVGLNGHALKENPPERILRVVEMARPKKMHKMSPEQVRALKHCGRPWEVETLGKDPLEVLR